jgi:hypothetical protein
MTLLKKLRKVTTVGANIDAIRDFSIANAVRALSMDAVQEAKSGLGGSDISI